MYLNIKLVRSLVWTVLTYGAERWWEKDRISRTVDIPSNDVTSKLDWTPNRQKYPLIQSLTPPDSFYELLRASSSPSLAAQSEVAGASWWGVRKWMGSEGLEDIGRHTVVTSQNGWLKAWRKYRGTALDGEDYCDERHGRMGVTPDGIGNMDTIGWSWWHHSFDSFDSFHMS